MKGTIKLSTLTNPPQRKQILIFDNKVSDVMRVSGNVVLLDVTGLGFYQFPLEKFEELSTLVVEYKEETYNSQDTYPRRTITHQLTIQTSQWQKILDKGLVGKEVEFEIRKGEWKSKITTYDQPDREWFVEYKVPIARIAFPSPKTYTEEEAKQLALDALDLGMRIRGEQLHPTGFIRKEWSGKSGKEIFNEWWENK